MKSTCRRAATILITIFFGCASASNSAAREESKSILGTGAGSAKLNPRIVAMKDNTWLKLPTPAEHPISRSSSPWMPYAPEAGVAILWGSSHSGYHNDVWTYNMSENLWREMLTTEMSAAVDQRVLKSKDGLLMTRLERPLAAHQWGRMDYDPDRRVLWHLGGNWQGIIGDIETYKKNGWELRQEGNPKIHQELTKKGPVLWQYSLKSNRWDQIYTEDTVRALKNADLIRYFPPLGRVIMTPSIVQPNGKREQFKTYDPDTNKWEPLDVVWEPMDEDVSPYWVYGYSPIVYDAKLRALVFILSNGGTWLLDPIAKTMRQVVSKDNSPPANLDGPVGSYVYDSASGTTLGIFADVLTYAAHEVLKKRGFPADRAFVLALDVDKNRWAIESPPANGVLPSVDASRMVHHYYDPMHNATLIYRGPYNSSATETWVYRHKSAEK